MPAETRRYSLVIPVDLFNELESLANDQKTTIVEILRKFIKLGLMVVRADESTKFIVRTDGVDREVVLL